MELQVTGGSELCFAGGAGQGPGSVHLLVVLLQQLRGLEVGLLVKIGYVVLALHHGAEEGGRERSHGRRLFEKNIKVMRRALYEFWLFGKMLRVSCLVD